MASFAKISDPEMLRLVLRANLGAGPRALAARWAPVVAQTGATRLFAKKAKKSKRGEAAVESGGLGGGLTTEAAEAIVDADVDMFSAEYAAGLEERFGAATAALKDQLARLRGSRRQRAASVYPRRDARPAREYIVPNTRTHRQVVL